MKTQKNKKNISKMKAEASDAQINENAVPKDELKYQLTRVDKKVVELFNPNTSYSKRTWSKLSNIEDTMSFIKEKDLFFPGEACLIVHNENNQIIAISPAPPSDQAAFEEMVFDTEEERAEYIRSNELKPSLSICPTEIQDMVRKFFNGEMCFFTGFREMHQSFFEQKSKLENDPIKLRSLYLEYEEKIIDILHNS